MYNFINKKSIKNVPGLGSESDSNSNFEKTYLAGVTNSRVRDLTNAPCGIMTLGQAHSIEIGQVDRVTLV